MNFPDSLMGPVEKLSFKSAEAMRFYTAKIVILSDIGTIAWTISDKIMNIFLVSLVDSSPFC